MAIVPAAEETARKILRAMVHRMKIRAGEGAPLGAVRYNAQAEGVEARDFVDGLEHAVNQGWTEYGEDRPWVGLTEKGFAAG